MRAPFFLPLLALLITLAAQRGESAGRRDLLHPRFTLTRGDLTDLCRDAPAAAAQRIAASPRELLQLLLEITDDSRDLLVLVDKTRAIPAGYKPADLVQLSDFPLKTTRKGFQLRSVVMDDLCAMAKAAEADGVVLPIGSAYRSFAYQQVLLDHSLKTQPREQVERELALPGHSQHQLGTAIDFSPIDASFAETPAGTWLFANAGRHGFSLSFPENGERETGYIYEPWHYRYVGKGAAAIIGGYFGGSQHAFVEWYVKTRGYLSAHERKAD